MSAPWLKWPVGARVVVRRRVEGGYSDVVGTLVSTAPDAVAVRRGNGELVEVPAALIAIGKVISPPPAPPASPALPASQPPSGPA